MITQLVRGNPGTSYLTCLMQLSGLSFQQEDQYTIFANGIRYKVDTFWAGVLSEFTLMTGCAVKVFVDSSHYTRIAAQDVAALQGQIFVEFQSDTWRRINSLSSKGCAVSVDLWCLGYGYHDYHFVVVKAVASCFSVYDPLSGVTRIISRRELGVLCISVKNNLGDVTIIMSVVNKTLNLL